MQQAIVLAALSSGVSLWFGAAVSLAQPHPPATEIHFQLARFTDITTQLSTVNCQLSTVNCQLFNKILL